MSEAAAAVTGITKAEFARRRGVSPGAVSHWIADRKIYGPALIGEGRNARINEGVAVAQLRAHLDPGQRVGNGIGTSLEPSAEVLPFERSAPPSAPVVDDTASRIQREKLEQLLRAGRRDKEEEAVRQGRLVAVEQVAQESAKAAGQMLTSFAGDLSQWAAAFAGHHKVPQRDALHLLRKLFLGSRSRAVEVFKRASGAMPETEDFDLGD